MSWYLNVSGQINDGSIVSNTFGSCSHITFHYRQEIMSHNTSVPTCNEAHEQRICAIASFLLQSANNEPQIDLHNTTQSGWIWASFGVFSPLCLFGIVGNLMTIVMFTRYIKRTTTSLFIIALAIVDFMMCAIAMPIWFYTLFNENMPSDIICRIDSFLQFWAVPVSGLILLAIAVDRFLLIFLVKTTVMTPLRAKVTIVIITVVCVGMALPWLFAKTIYHQIGPEATSRMCEGGVVCNFELCRIVNYNVPYSTLYNLWVTNMVSFFMFCILFTMAYLLIFIKVYRVHNKMSTWQAQHQSPPKIEVTRVIDEDHLTFASHVETNGNSVTPNGEDHMTKSSYLEEKTENDNLVKSVTPATNNNQKNSKTPVKKKKLPHLHTAITVSLVTMTYILAYAPMTVISLARTCVDNDSNLSSVCPKNTAEHFLWNFFYLNHITNPIIYAFMNPRFKEALKGIFCRKRRAS